MSKVHRYLGETKRDYLKYLVIKGLFDREDEVVQRSPDQFWFKCALLVVGSFKLIFLMNGHSIFIEWSLYLLDQKYYPMPIEPHSLSFGRPLPKNMLLKGWGGKKRGERGEVNKLFKLYLFISQLEILNDSLRVGREEERAKEKKNRVILLALHLNLDLPYFFHLYIPSPCFISDTHPDIT
jgi:hypothetical protein